MRKIVSSLIMALFFSTFVYLLIPTGISSKEVIASYNNLRTDVGSHGQFDKNIFANYRQVQIEKKNKSDNVSNTGEGADDKGLSVDLSKGIVEQVEKADLNEKRKALILKGMELMNYTKYNYGSKADLNSNEKPERLDCSGFSKWAYWHTFKYDIGDGTIVQYKPEIAVEKKDLCVGDLGFKRPGGATSHSNSNHVGMFVGWVKGTKKEIWLHCTSNVGVVAKEYSAFSYYARPKCLSE